jgi:uncharacterized protein (TIGR03546 family)
MVKALETIYERFIRIRGTPKEIALGFALGLFLGLSPSLGIQTVVAVFLASIFKWNKYAAAIGVWVTNPFTAPFIYSATYLVGAKIMKIDNSFDLRDNLDWSVFIDLFQNSPGIITSLFAGGVVIGIPVALIGYFIAFRAVEKYQKSLKDKIKHQKDLLKEKVHQKKQLRTAARQLKKENRGNQTPRR